MTRVQKFFLVFLLALATLAVAVIENYRSMNSTLHTAQKSFVSVTVGSTTLKAEVVDTDASRAQGLSGRTGLLPGEAMLFVFDRSDAWGFWMKDMRFPIDIIWLNGDGTVVTVADDLSPASYPEVFYPAAPAQFVLEVPAGFARAHKVAQGSKVVVQ